MLLDEFAVAGFFETVGLLPEEFKTAVKSFGGKRCSAGGALVKRSAGETQKRLKSEINPEKTAFRQQKRGSGRNSGNPV